MSITDNFVKTYTDKNYRYTTTVRHQGTVIAFAMDDQRCIYYSVLDLNQSSDAATNSLDVNLWLENPQRLVFPREITQVGFSVADPTVMPLTKRGRSAIAQGVQLKPEEIDPFLSSTARLSADAPFQVISDGKNVCILRQAIDKDDRNQVFVNKTAPVVNSTLLLDRFVLVGNTLEPKREVRFQRSRHKTRPQSDKDSLNALDMEGNPFVEPTQELEFIRNLSNGRFTVVVLPTQIATIQRWQFFVYNSKTKLIDSYNLEQSLDRLFNTQGTSVSETRTISEFALSFNGKDNRIEIANPQLPIGNSAYTIEAWVKGKGAIVSWGKNASNALQLTDSELANTWSGSDLIAKAKVSKAWHHVAATYDGKTRILYLDGVKVGEDQPATANIQASSIAQIGAIDGQNLFEGTIDEVRIWNRAIASFEIAENLSQRLIGNEPGLVAYWRLDEATGTQIFDQTDSAQQGKILGTATWVKSDAPIQDTSSICQDSFKLEGRDIASGLSALMYYQQEKSVSGYDQTQKPFKQNARVMLAVNTKGATDPEISILDFAVSREGKLAQSPNLINLPQLVIQTGTEQLKKAIADREAKIPLIKQAIEQLQKQLAALAIEA